MKNLILILVFLVSLGVESISLAESATMDIGETRTFTRVVNPGGPYPDLTFELDVSMLPTPGFTLSGCTHAAGTTLHCEYQVSYTATEAGVYTADLNAIFRHIRTDDPTKPGVVEDIGEDYRMTVNVRPQRCESSEESGSIVAPDSRSLREAIKIVGTPFDLVYSSQNANDFSGTAKAPKMRGYKPLWGMSVHHYYRGDTSRLHRGDGPVVYAKELPFEDESYMVLSASGEEGYIFGPDEEHLRTINTLTGSTKYTFEYDENYLTKITDSYGNETSINMNPDLSPNFIISPDGQVTQLIFNTGRQLSQVKDPAGQAYGMTYKPSTTLLSSFTKPGGQTSTMTYSSGKLVKDTGYGGNSLEFLTNSAGDKIMRTQMGRAKTWANSHTSSGNTTKVEIDKVGFASTNSETLNGSSIYSSPLLSSSSTRVNDERFGDASQRLSQSSTTIAGVTSTTNFSQSVSQGSGTGLFDYSSIQSSQSVSGRTSYRTFNRSSRTWLTQTPAGATSILKLDTHEKPIESQRGSDTPVTFAYDVRGRPTEVKQGSKNKMTYSYRPDGFLDFKKNQRNEITTYSYDLLGRVTKETLPDLRFILYSYDPNGNLTGITPPGRNLHAFTFNAMELPSQYQPPLLSGVPVVNTSYSYNLDKQMTQITRPNGQSASFNYSSATGLLESIVTANGNFTHLYSSSVPGQLSSVQSPYGIKNVLTYRGPELSGEEQIRVSDSASMGKVTFGFDNDHRRNSRTVMDSAGVSHTVNSTLNDDGVPTQVGAMELAYSYPSGRLVTSKIGNISDARTYDSYGNLESYIASLKLGSEPAVNIYSYTLGRDSMSRIVAISETIGSQTSETTYGYDTAGRLITVTINGTLLVTYGYDSNGNRTSQVINGVTTASTFDEHDRIINFGGKIYSHDQNGDLTGSQISNGSGESFSYDVFGNLASAINSKGQSRSYQMDGSNRRVARSVNGQVVQRFIYQDQLRIAAELDGNGLLKSEFIYATGAIVPDYMIRAGTNYRIISNHLGSPRLVVNTLTGKISQKVDYNVFGTIALDSNTCFQPFGFAAGLRDPDSRLIRFGARDYDPEVGRWTSKDPILFNGGDTNLFGYVQNDPVNWIDPEGESAVGYVRDAGTVIINHIINGGNTNLNQLLNRVYTENIILDESNFEPSPGGQCPVNGGQRGAPPNLPQRPRPGYPPPKGKKYGV